MKMLKYKYLEIVFKFTPQQTSHSTLLIIQPDHYIRKGLCYFVYSLHVWGTMTHSNLVVNIKSMAPCTPYMPFETSPALKVTVWRFYRQKLQTAACRCVWHHGVTCAESVKVTQETQNTSVQEPWPPSMQNPSRSPLHRRHRADTS